MNGGQGDNVRSLQPATGRPGGGNGGGTSIDSRLASLEAHMQHVATKHVLAMWVGGTALVNFLILLGHLAIRTLGGD